MSEAQLIKKLNSYGVKVTKDIYQLNSPEWRRWLAGIVGWIELGVAIGEKRFDPKKENS